jgi:hypothetical protein
MEAVICHTLTSHNIQLHQQKCALQVILRGALHYRARRYLLFFHRRHDSVSFIHLLVKIVAGIAQWRLYSIIQIVTVLAQHRGAKQLASTLSKKREPRMLVSYFECVLF